jgi:hypothetical protein
VAGHDLIPASAYEELPQDSVEQFLVLTAVAEATLASEEKISGGDSSGLRKRFMGELGAVADELGVGILPPLSSGGLTTSDWQDFRAALAGLKTRLRLRKVSVSRNDSVELNRVTKARIELEIDNLRRLIGSADLTDKKKVILNKKLDELLDELHRRRLSFAKLAAVVAAVAGIIGGTTSTIANAPEALESIGKILQLIGEAKAVEEEEQLLLAPPPKALPAPKQAGNSSDDAPNEISESGE